MSFSTSFVGADMDTKPWPYGTIFIYLRLMTHCDELKRSKAMLSMLY